MLARALESYKRALENPGVYGPYKQIAERIRVLREDKLEQLITDGKLEGQMPKPTPTRTTRPSIEERRAQFLRERHATQETQTRDSIERETEANLKRLLETNTKTQK